MTTQFTRWTLDTCPCTVLYSWDDSTSGNTRVHTLENILKCPAHDSLSDSNAFSTILNENPRKGGSLQIFLDNGPTSLWELNEDGARILKKGIKFNFSWSGTAPNRVLTISFTGITLTTQQKATAQNLINNKFGSGKVIVA